MQSISSALTKLHEEAVWFVRAKEARLLVVRVSSDLRSTVAQLLPKYEFDRDNFSPWLVLDDAHTAADGGWRARAVRLHDHWECRRQLFLDREGIEMPAPTYSNGQPSTVGDVVPDFAGFDAT